MATSLVAHSLRNRHRGAYFRKSKSYSLIFFSLFIFAFKLSVWESYAPRFLILNRKKKIIDIRIVFYY